MSNVLIDLINLSKDSNYRIDSDTFNYLLYARLIDSNKQITKAGFALIAKFGENYF